MREKKGFLYLNGIAIIFLNITEVLIFLALSKYIQFLDNPDDFKSDFLFFIFTHDVYKNTFWIALVVYSIASKLILSYCVVHTGNKLGVMLSAELFDRVISGPYKKFNGFPSSSLLSMIVTQPIAISNSIFIPFLYLISSLILLVLLLFAGIITLGVLLLLIFLLIAVIYGIVYFWSKRAINKISQIQKLKQELALELAQESIDGYRYLQNKTLFKHMSNSFRNTQAEYRNGVTTSKFLSRAPRSVIEGLVIAVFVALVDVGNGPTDVTFNQAFLLPTLFLTLRIVPAIERCFSSIIQINTASNVLIGVTDIFKDRSWTSCTDMGFRDDPKFFEGKLINSKSKEIVIRNLNFSYEGRQIFKNFSCAIKVGKVNVITGESGSGKSTLLDILTGLVSPERIEVYVDSELVAGGLLSIETFEYVPQKQYIFNGTVLQNMFLRFEDNDFSSQECAEAERILSNLELSNIICLNDFLINNASKLSGGQRQRLGLSRSLISKKEIIIIDEGLGAVSSKMRSKIIDLYVKEKKTVIIVTHDTDLIKNAQHLITLY